jgi:flagellar hook assembly protein FlgD
VKVYSIVGRMVNQFDVNNIDQKFVKINWDGRDGDGDILANGTYLYKIIVKTQDGEFNKSVMGKMAVIR